MDQSAPAAHVHDLDALRGIAIFGVVMTHVAASLALMGMVLPFLPLDLTQLFVTGGLGVQLFFLLSGFLLTTTEGRRYAAGTASIQAYARRRFLRLAPAYYLSLPIYLLVAIQLGQYKPHPNAGLDLLTYVTFLHWLTYGTNSAINPSYWSLTAEVVFYAALPLILRYVPTMRSRLLLYLASLLLAAGTYYWYALDPQSPLGWYLIFHPAAHLHLFLAGMLLAGLAERKALGARGGGSAGSLSAAHRSGDRAGPARPGRGGPLQAITGDAVLLLALCGLILNAYLRSPTPAQLVLSRLGGETLVAVGFASYVLGSPLLRNILALPGLAYLGRISYSVFLFHGLVLLGLERAGLVNRLQARAAAGVPHLALFGAYLALTLTLSIALSSLTYRWVEVPGMRGFRRPRPALAPAAAT